MIGSVVRRSEDDINTVGFAKGERVRDMNSVCVGGEIRGNKKKIKIKVQCLMSILLQC